MQRDMLQILNDVPLSPHTTFHIGGVARYLTAVHNEDEIREALLWAREQQVPYLVLGGGSNVLISDDGFDGLVLHMQPGDISFANPEVVVDAGCTFLNVIRTASDQGLGGWERLAGIPGSIGGAVRGNAGAFGVEIKDVLTKVCALHAETLEIREFENAECAFGYRTSFFKHHPEWIITRAYVGLHRVDSEKSLVLIDEIIAERERRHLQDVRAAGSFFTNPEVGEELRTRFETEKATSSHGGRIPSGWLIEKAGLRGTLKIGGAEVSAQHANYIVNDGTATAADVRAVAEQVKAKVKEQFGVELEEEVSYVK
jgi:UDP-N-acetylmuramate dehydrogenase